MSDSEKMERRTHFRGKARPGRRVELEYRLADGSSDKPLRAFTRNIGVGGAFIVTDDPYDVGALITVTVHVPTSDITIEVAAEVRWRAVAGAEEVGMGIKFQHLDVEQLLQLSEYFASLTGTEAAL